MAAQDGAALQKALVRSVHYESEGVVSLHLELLEGGPAEWEAGAHLDVVVGDGSTRQYSLSGRPGDPRYRIAVLRESDGRGGSEFLHRQIRPGDVLEIKGPRNHFGLEDAPAYVLLAGGIGITPLLPMMAALEERGASWTLHYLGRSLRTMAFRAELESYGDRVQLHPRDDGERPALSEIVEAAPDGALFYVCGPERMLEGMREALAGHGGEERLRTELFSVPEADADAGPANGFTVELSISGLTLEVPEDKTILEVVNAAGIEVMTDCEEGICGSCETKVTAGEVDHRDYVLTAQEKAANDCMMVCVSRAAGGCPRLVLEL